MAWPRLLADRSGTTTVEFAVIAPLFFVLVLGFIELSLALYWWKSTEKAAQIGARWAIVRDLTAAGVPNTNTKAETGVFGLPCHLDPSPCTGWEQSPYVCDGSDVAGTCNQAAFDVLLQRMQGIFPVIRAEHLRIAYFETGLGFAGGPAIPAVSVQLVDVPFQLGVIGLIFGLIGDERPMLSLPTISATFTGEDLSSAGA